MTTIPFAQPGIAAFETGDIFASVELFNSTIPQVVTEDFAVASGVVLPQFAVVGVDASDNLVMATDDYLPGSHARGELTFTGVATANETVTIGSVTYTLKAAPAATANEVKIGATAAETAANLAAAINRGAGAGTLYGSATTEHPDVEARTNSAGVVGVSASKAGIAGNAIATTETSAAASFASATPTGGLAEVGAKAIGITTMAVLSVGHAQRVAIYRQGNFNPAALAWDPSFDTDAKKAAAFRGAPAPTNILIRKRL